MISRKWIVLWSLWAARFVRQPTPAVHVTSGLVRGSVSNNGLYLSYLNIPYATVQRRFQAPGPEPIWQGIFEAIDEHVHCTQKIIGLNIISGQEDCLVVNVYSPLNNSLKTLIPVMIFIHGGGFFSGSGAPFLYGPDYLVSKGVILVTFNYRLSILGQLCLRTKDVPGNAAMKDQVAALRWVQRNISKFGGNPNDVTIFGESAGGVSVSYHLLSPKSKGLFHKAILQSGSSLAGWALQYNPVYSASKLAKVLGLHTEEPKDIYNFLIDKSDRELVSLEVSRAEGSTVLSNMHFSPCVEHEIEGEESFITELPYNLLNRGEYTKVPTMIGTNDEEGYFFMQFEKEFLSTIEFEKSMPPDLIFPNEEERSIAANILKKLYMGEDIISMSTLVNFSRFEGDPNFIYPAAQETEFLLKTNDQPIYNYLFNYDGRRNMVKFIVGEPISSGPGASHADDLFYVFNQIWLPMFGEKAMVDRITSLWTNFAKYGNPTPDSSLGFQWAPTKFHDPQTLVLGEATPFTRSLWHSDSVLYWKELYSKYRRMGD